MRIYLLSFCIVFGALFMPIQRAHAFDPVTIGLLTPIALGSAPMVIKGLQGAGMELVLVGKEALTFLLLPVGLIQSVFLWPLGQFAPGVGNMVRGTIAPFKMVFHTIMVPFKLVSGFF